MVNMKYQRIIDRRTQCNNLYDSNKDVNYLMEMDCIDHFFECEIYKTYESILNFCIANNFKTIYDIGCAYGHQSEVFINSNINYVGINNYKHNYWNKNKYNYISQQYPFKINTRENELAVSVLCLTWNCYLYNGEQTLKEQCEALQRDFNNCLLYISKDKIDYVNKYFKNYRVVDGNLIYFYN